MLRACDVLFSIIGLLFSFPILLIFFILGLFDTGSPIYRQVRIGQHQKKFFLVKFRTMKLSTLSVPSHLVDPNAVTKLGYFMRRTKLDELPQLWNVLLGDMSLVGPRPGLLNHQELSDARKKYRVFDVVPGITGLAQVSKIDMSTPYLLAITDNEMIRHLTLRTYFRYIFMTVPGVKRLFHLPTSDTID